MMKDLRKLIICALLGATTLLAFWPVLHAGFINFDDPDYVTQNPDVLHGLSGQSILWAFKTAHSCNWHPLTWISHMVDIQFYGLNPAGHHFTSLMLHIANAILVYLVIRRMIRSEWTSAFVAALFALHPLRVESVAWVSERKDVLSTFFFLLTLLCYLHYAQRRGKPGTHDNAQAAQTDRKTRTSFALYFGSLFLFTLGLLSKPMVVTLPFVLLLLDFWPLERWNPTRLKLASKQTQWSLLEKLPFFGLSAVSSYITFVAQNSQGAVTISGLPWDTRVANALLSYGSYLLKFVAPVNLAIFYQHPALTSPELKDWITWRVPVAAGAVFLLTIAAFLWLRRRPYFAVGWFWFLGMLVPVIGLIQAGSQGMADRYTYIPMIGVSLIATLLLLELFQRFSVGAGSRTAAGIFVLGACAVLTWKQCGRWHDSASVFKHALAVTSNNSTAHFNYGAALEAGGDLRAAIPHYQASIQADPFRSDAHYNLGHAYADQGHSQEAMAEYQTAIQLKPDYAEAHHNLGTVYYSMGRREDAQAEYKKALEIQPRSPLVEVNYARLLSDEGNFAEAVKYYSDALAQTPSNVTAEVGLGLSLVMQDKFSEGIPHLEHVVELMPTNVEARVNLGNAFYDSGRPDEARKHFDLALATDPSLVATSLQSGEKLESEGQPGAALARYTLAVRLAPKNPVTHDHLALLLAKQGRLNDALKSFSEAERLRPDAQSHYNLALVLVALKRHAEAIEQYRKALELKPEWPTALNDLAWILATHPNAGLRNGGEAVRLAQKACAATGDKEPRYWGTLDAAYAEAGDFKMAKQIAEKTVELARAAKQSQIADAASERLALYLAGKPYHQTIEKP
jgi:tetratricopeptide (TPR) repeat protein